MSIEALSSEDRAKIKKLIEEGIRVKQEIADLNEGLKDVVKNVAADLSIAPKALNKAITMAFRSTLNEEKDTLNDVEEILVLAGRS